MSEAEETEEQVTLVCGSADDLDQIRGSIIVQCSSCDQDVMASPSGQAVMEEKRAKPLCMRCAHMSILAYKNQTGKTPRSGMAAGVASELAEWAEKKRRRWL